MAPTPQSLHPRHVEGVGRWGGRDEKKERTQLRGKKELTPAAIPSTSSLFLLSGSGRGKKKEKGGKEGGRRRSRKKEGGAVVGGVPLVSHLREGEKERGGEDSTGSNREEEERAAKAMEACIVCFPCD